MGLSIGIGLAISSKRKGGNFNVYVILGDGECNEGAVWEFKVLVPHLKLNNIIKNSYR